MEIKKQIKALFSDYGVKFVSKTDKEKSAYVLNKQQVEVLSKAGRQPSKTRPADSFEIIVLGDSSRTTIKATYYNAERKGSGRTVEPRLGTDIISDWLKIDDELFLATAGKEIYAMKLNDSNINQLPDKAVQAAVISTLPDAYVLKRAKQASKKARKTRTSTEVYVRDPFVIEAAKRRAKGKCEMPGCGYIPFETERGEAYLEGHHIEPLSEGGDDELLNVAALCPVCHRELHYGKARLTKRAILKKKIRKKHKLQ